MKKILFVGIIVTLLSSCVSSKYFYEHYSDISYVNDSTLTKLEGTYKCKPKNIDDIRKDPNLSSLDQIIFNPFYINKWTDVSDFSGEVTIKVLSKNKLSISLYKDGVIENKILKGKIVNNYFEVNKKRKFVGFPFTYFKLDVAKMKLGLSDNNDLIVSCGRYHFGSIFIVFGESHPSPPLSYFPRK